MCAIKRSITALVIFASLSVLQPRIRAQIGGASCVSNYAELKRALFENGTGNMERLLYAFTPTNKPIPHYVWVYYFHNESSEWEDVLTCPEQNNLDRCPDNGVNDAYKVFFWADSPLLINMDIPLLKFLSYNILLQYLGEGACVQLVIPPFCDSVESQLAIEMLKFCTSYLQVYSFSTTESDQDHVLYCEEKLEIESQYDDYLVASEAIIWLGGIVIFAFCAFKLCSGKEEPAGKMWTRVCSLCLESRRGGNVEDRSANDVGRIKQSQQISTSGINQPNKNKHFSSQTYKTYISVFLIIMVATVFFFILDVIELAIYEDILTAAFSNIYGGINFVLIFLTASLILIAIILYAIRLIIYTSDCIRFESQETNNNYMYKDIVTCIGTILTSVSFLYILSRMFMILLAFATYPYDVGFTLLAIGSIVIAFLFVVWAAFHITADSCKIKRKWKDIFISLTPYIALFLVLFGFLLSYIAVILSNRIHPADPVTSLASTLFPVVIAFVTSTQYEKQRKLLSDDAGEQKQPMETINTSSSGTTRGNFNSGMSSPSTDEHPPEVVAEHKM